MPGSKQSAVTKEAYEEFLQAYLRLVKKAEVLECNGEILHRDILQAIDHKKMGRIIGRINKIKQNT